MKKNILILALSILTVTNSWGDQVAPSTESAKKNTIKFVCEPHDLYWARDKRYFPVAFNNEFLIILADAENIQINRQNKTIEVWTSWFASDEARQKKIKTFGEKSEFSNYGYTKTLNIINYETMKIAQKSFTHYSCDGNNIYSDDKIYTSWADIEPKSLMAQITESIIKKYNIE